MAATSPGLYQRNRFMKKIFLIVAAIAAIAVSGVTAQHREFTPADKLRYAFAIIEGFYVDSVDSNKIVEEGIVSMLKELDPHSAYSNPEETKEMTAPLQGNFSGIGIQFNMLNDTLFVIQTTAGGPSEKVGILAGDRILSANDTLISGVNKKNTDVIKLLRGPKGTRVDVKVLRRGEKEPLEFRIVRDDIPIYSVDASYMADPTTGYIRLSRFSETSVKEINEAMAKLRKQGMKNLILDLQDNGGGLMGPASELSEKFLRRGDMIVFTKGRVHRPNKFLAEVDGDFQEGRVVVLVNQYSASASEILSGALQDNDRGVIVGRRTFGKGLVQRPMPFPDGSMIKLTYSRYYTPSGRCIQKPYANGHPDDYNDDMLKRYESGELMHADSIHLDKSEKYYTLRNKRMVYGGGGIMPDLFVPLDTASYSPYYRNLVAKGALNQYCIDYVDSHRKELKKQYPTEVAFISGFKVTPELMRGLVEWGVKEGVEYVDKDYSTSKMMMETIVKAMIGRDLYDVSTYYRIANTLNPVYTEGLRLINDSAAYNKLLAPPSKPE